MGANYSKVKESTKTFFNEKSKAEMAYLAIAGPVILAQLIFIQLNYKKISGLVPSQFGFNGNVIKRAGKWSLYLLPVASAFMVLLNMVPRIKEFFSRLNFLKPKNASISATFSLLTGFLAYATFSQVRIAQGKQARINPAVTFSILSAAIALPVGDVVYHAVKDYKSKAKVEVERKEETKDAPEITTESAPNEEIKETPADPNEEK